MSAVFFVPNPRALRAYVHMQAPFMNTEEEEVKQLLNETGQDAEQEKLQEALEKLPSKRTG
jgi:hypothetical protein